VAKVAAQFRCAAGQVVGDQFGMGIDDTHMKIRGAPVLDEKMIADKLAVSELMSMAVVALPPIVKVCPVKRVHRLSQGIQSRKPYGKSLGHLSCCHDLFRIANRF